MAQVAITGPNDPCEVHKAGCADLRSPKFRERPWTIDVSTWTEVAEEIWGEPAADTLEYGSPEWRTECVAWFQGDYRIMPCAPKLAD